MSDADCTPGREPRSVAAITFYTSTLALVGIPSLKATGLNHSKRVIQKHLPTNPIVVNTIFSQDPAVTFRLWKPTARMYTQVQAFALKDIALKCLTAFYIFSSPVCTHLYKLTHFYSLLLHQYFCCFTLYFIACIAIV